MDGRIDDYAINKLLTTSKIFSSQKIGNNYFIKRTNNSIELSDYLEDIVSSNSISDFESLKNKIKEILFIEIENEVIHVLAKEFKKIYYAE